LIWIALVALSFTRPDFTLTTVAMWWSVSGLLLLGARGLLAHEAMGAGSWSPRAIRLNSILALLSFGLLVALAQAADFLYAPTDNILINRFIDPLTVAVYAPAIQIDAGLLLLVGGLAAVLLPRSALAHAGGDTAQVRRYYRKGTAFSIALLLPAALLIWLLAPHIFRLWLNDSMPATTAILPLVLIHTVVGGSSAVGRSVLLAVGKVKPFTTAVLIAGVANVILSFAFVYYGHLGLRGIILGTIIAVVGRCGVWMPWYVNRVLKNPSAINVV
jgi:O-antigen/teichoic acid export membrane protein